MAVTNFVVSGLSNYVQTNQDIIIKNFALVGTDTRKRIGIQTGVKLNAYLNYLALDSTMQDGSSCGFNPLDSLTLTQKQISTAVIKVDGQICEETLLGKYAEYLVKVNAVDNDCPFEQYIVDTLVADLNKKIEKLIWQGDTTQTGDATIKWINGILKQLASDGNKVTASITAGTNAYDGLMTVYMAMPEETLEKGGLIFVSPAIYRAFLADMVALNFYHYSGPQDSYPDEFILPGSDVKVVRTPGLSGSLKVVGTFAENLVYGCDMENDAERIRFWWSDDDGMWKYQVKWNSGIAYHFSDQMVLGTFSATPSPLTPNNNLLKSIATSEASVATVMADVHDDANNAITTKAAS